MTTTLPEFLERKHHAPVKPTPPTHEMMEALRKPLHRVSFPPLDRFGVPEPEVIRIKEPVVPEREPKPAEPNPFFRFQFKRPWFGEYTTKQYKFVLRVEHFPELLRLVSEFNKAKSPDEFPVGVSDIVSAALDFVLEHRLVLAGLRRPEEIREEIALSVYRKAFFPIKQLYDTLQDHHAR